MLNQNGMLHCSCLASTQEEADTRIILHALHSDKLYQENNVQGRIVVKSPDTDVLVLLVHYFQNMKNTSELWFQTGLITSTKDCRRYIPVHDLCKSLSSVVCEILPADHALTGCDTTSSFFGIGKNSMFKVLKEPPNQFSDLSRIEWFSRSKPKTNIKAVWSEGKAETMPYRSEQIAGKIGNCQRFYFGETSSEWRHI